jgi:hypothetical protein
MSCAAPGGNAMTTRMGFEGNACAFTPQEKIIRQNSKIVRILILQSPPES